MLLKTISYLLLLSLVYPNNNFAQEVPFEFNLVKGTNGISLGKITGITQDTYGYMWFVDQTNSGQVVKYDGYRMKAFKNLPGDTNSLNPGGYECIASDSLGNVWAGVTNGVDKINSATGIVTHYKLKPNYSSAIMVDHSGYVWLGTDNGLCRLDPTTGNTVYYSHNDKDPNSISSNIIRIIYEDREGTIWVGCGLPFVPTNNGGLNKLNRATGKFTRYMHDPNNPQSIINDKVRAICEDSKGNFWIGTQGDGLQIMNRKTGTFERLTYDPNHPEKLSRPPIAKGDAWDHITFIKEDISGNIWIGTYHQGIVRYDPLTKKTTHFIGDKSSQKSFNDSTTWCAFSSRDGTLWIATETSAVLYRVDPFRKQIPYVSLQEYPGYVVEDKNGDLWLGSDDMGIFKLDHQKNIIAHFKHDPLDSSSLPDHNNAPILISIGDSEKILSLGRMGVRIFDAHLNRFSRFINNKAFNDSSDIGFVDVIKDKEGILWFATWNRGLLRFDPKDSSTKQFVPNPKDSTSISSNNLSHVIEDNHGRLWITGGDGINRMDRTTNKFKHYLPGTFTVSIFQDSRNIVWAGTEKSLYYYDEKKDIFSPFFDPSTYIGTLPTGCISEDDDHNLWLVSQSAIIKLNPVTGEHFIYGNKFGIEQNSMAPWGKTSKNKNGQLLISSGNGFFMFYPHEIDVKENLKVTLTDLFINNLPVIQGKQNAIKEPIEKINSLNLKYNQNNIAINFSAMDFRDPDGIQYLTMLEGYDNTWREAKGEKTSYYFGLPRGKFTYHVKAFNANGTAEKTLIIVVNPPWWQTWWAYTVYAVLLIIAIWGYTKWRTKTLQKEKLVLERKVGERTQELKKEKETVESTLAELKSTQAQLIHSEKMASLGELTAGVAHEIQNPLNFVNNFSEVNKEMVEEAQQEIKNGNIDEVKNILNDIKDNSEKISHHGKRADAIVKSMLQHSRKTSGQKEPTNINALCDEYLRLSFHGLRAKDKSFNTEINTDFDDSIEKINIVPQDIGRVLLNLFNNAFYAVNEKKKNNETSATTYKPLVSVRTQKLNNKVEIVVSDNGNGIPQNIVDKIFQPFFTTKPTGEGTGLGLSLSYDIIKAHRGELKVKTKEGEGSEFIITIPI